MEISQSAGKSFAYLVGVYLGDGCVTKVQGYDRFRLNTIDLDFAQATAEAISQVSEYRAIINGPYQDKRFSKSAPQYQLYWGDRGMCSRLVDETGGKQFIPALVHEAPRDEQLAFVAGLMDSEGFVSATSGNHTNRRWHMGFRSTDVWTKDFARLLEKLGIRVLGFKEEKPTIEGRRLIYRFGIKMQSWVDAKAYFRCSRKQRRVEEWASLPAYAMRKRHPRRLASETTRQTA
jgi:hypothetical protein